MWSLIVILSWTALNMYIMFLAIEECMTSFILIPHSLRFQDHSEGAFLITNPTLLSTVAQFSWCIMMALSKYTSWIAIMKKKPFNIPKLNIKAYSRPSSISTFHLNVIVDICHITNITLIYRMGCDQLGWIISAASNVLYLLLM